MQHSPSPGMTPSEFAKYTALCGEAQVEFVSRAFSLMLTGSEDYTRFLPPVPAPKYAIGANPELFREELA